VIPTSPDYIYYPAAFDVNSFLGATEPFYSRADVQANLMIDSLILSLESDGYNVQAKVFVEGFSTGGMFSQRYGVLHPERIKALAAGHIGGFITLPIYEYDYTDLNWPLGLNDYEILIGNQFKFNEYANLPQFLYIGENDTKKSLLKILVCWVLRGLM